MPELAYLENSFIPLAEARVPVNDRGYLFADGIYEVIVTREGRPFLQPEHLARLEHSAAGINLRLPAPLSQLEKLIATGIAKAGFAETMVYLQVTRGTAPRRHDYPGDLEPNLLLTFRPRPEYPPELGQEGIGIITVPEIRWARCDIKSIALLPNVMMKQQAVEKGCREALFVCADDTIRECTAANIFFVKNDTLFTPPADHHILAGITRGFIIKQASARKIEVCERKCTLEELREADEAFITSSTMDLLPVTTVDGHAIGNGRPGPLTSRIRGFFP
ncbi:MAG: D-amino acid aminotransferase [Deltaproteobacteria bacterium]|nr:D-amino acid aminotransferase [Deltaproteobacteria bacterium]